MQVMWNMWLNTSQCKHNNNEAFKLKFSYKIFFEWAFNELTDYALIT